jgi:hypothetical protein
MAAAFVLTLGDLRQRIGSIWALLGLDMGWRALPVAWHPSDIAAALAWSMASLDSSLARPCGLEEAGSVMPPLVGDLVRPR